MRDQLDNAGARLMLPSDMRRWDAFVDACPQATFFHRSGWQQVIEQGFGHRTWFYYTEEEGRITGVLPLGEVKSRLFGHSLVALPFCVYGGIAASTEHARAQLAQAAEALAHELGVGHLEYRTLSPVAAADPSYVARDLYFTFRKQISDDREAILRGIPRKQRAVVRKAIAHGLQSRIDASPRRFYRLFAQSVHRLGTPVFAARYFELLKLVFGDRCEFRIVEDRGTAVSAVLSFYFRDEVIPYYAGASGRARECGANDFMYWSLMHDAAERAYTVFDFGRSKAGTGAFDFKKNWGFTPQALPYQYKLVRATRLPDNQPLNPRYGPLIGMWKRLPLPLANLLGPFISRHLG